MDIKHLWAAELPSGYLNTHPDLQSSTTKELLWIPTCQRTVVLGYGNDTDHARTLAALSQRFFKSIEAYEFLLRFTSGLESEIKGETDVFGQVKQAFKSRLSPHETLFYPAEFFTIVEKHLIEDTKEIRTQYLQGIGGNTYGALSRKLMGPTLHDSIMMIGAGQISKSVAPYFCDFRFAIWNRSEKRLHELAGELMKKSSEKFSWGTDQDFFIKHIKRSSWILIAAPVGSEFEATLMEHRNPDSKILHLGAQNKDLNTHAIHWNHPSLNLNQNLFTLSHLFEMERKQADLRSRQVERAMMACRERATLRGLNPQFYRSAHLAHGWEDLAVFQ